MQQQIYFVHVKVELRGQKCQVVFDPNEKKCSQIIFLVAHSAHYLVFILAFISQSQGSHVLSAVAQILNAIAFHCFVMNRIVDHRVVTYKSMLLATNSFSTSFAFVHDPWTTTVANHVYVTIGTRVKLVRRTATLQRYFDVKQVVLRHGRKGSMMDSLEKRIEYFSCTKSTVKSISRQFSSFTWNKFEKELFNRGAKIFVSFGNVDLSHGSNIEAKFSMESDIFLAKMVTF
ncbi:hypothetical protein BpHYR1_038048 [Brachionus plicatilis]|uniref:Uncharacterized protein n=1 Tax=Brachionus plicatilis TaxID=10195 RepID=A0A3M7P331_BRAPC|nr:hypothetical protein BpHYR1_038048 [Brachionus plicatilis]